MHKAFLLFIPQKHLLFAAYLITAILRRVKQYLILASFSLHPPEHHFLGEGTGTPLQDSCLENLMDGGAWWAAVHGVAKSWTQLSDFPFPFHFHALEKEMATSPVFSPGEPQGRGSLVGFRLWGRTESETTEAT